MTFTGRVLALDLATTTGWAAGVPGSIPLCGHVRFSKGGASHAETYREFRKWLEAMVKHHRMSPDLIVYESPAVPSFMGGKTNISTTRLLFGLAEHLEEWCYDRYDLRQASVSQVRAHFIGQNMKAKIAKPLTLERCQQMGWPATTTDESDAAALWSFQCAWLNPQLAWRHTPLFTAQK